VPPSLVGEPPPQKIGATCRRNDSNVPLDVGKHTAAVADAAAVAQSLFAEVMNVPQPWLAAVCVHCW
jgi:hypothetical protein